MSLEEKLLADFKDAMKNRESAKVSTLSFLRAQLSYSALEKKKDKLDDADVLNVIKRLIKQHQDSIDQFKLGNRTDLVEKEEKELVILKSYVPEEVSADELKKIIGAVVKDISAEGMKDMGKVMKEVLVRTAGRADNKTVSELVRDVLSKPQ